MQDPVLRRKLAWLIGFRAVISTVLLGGATVAQIRSPGSFPVDPFFLLIAVTYALAVVYAMSLRFVERHRWLIDVQLVSDALIVTAFIYLTGGIESVFSSLYLLPIVAGSTVQFRRGSLLVAAFSTVLYIGLVLAQYLAATGWLDLAFGPLGLERVISGTDVLNVRSLAVMRRLGMTFDHEAQVAAWFSID